MIWTRHHLVFCNVAAWGKNLRLKIVGGRRLSGEILTYIYYTRARALARIFSYGPNAISIITWYTTWGDKHNIIYMSSFLINFIGYGTVFNRKIIYENSIGPDPHTFHSVATTF